MFKESGERQDQSLLSDTDRQNILMRADLRLRAYEFKRGLLNLNPIETTSEHREHNERVLSLAKKEADGTQILMPKEAEKTLTQKEAPLKFKAQQMQEVAPNFSAYALAYLAELKQITGQDYQPTLDQARKIDQQKDRIPNLTPSNLMADAILLGMQKRALRDLPLPPLEKIAQNVLANEELLQSLGLVLTEEQRQEFLKAIPESERQRVSNILDLASSKVLHQSMVEKGTPDEEQRRAVRKRLYEELSKSLGDEKYTDKHNVKLIGQALGELGEDSRQLFLELIRDETSDRTSKQEAALGEDNDRLPRVIKIMLDNFDDYRANDLILKLAADQETNHHLSIYLFGKLVEKKYLPADVNDWWQSKKSTARLAEKRRADEGRALEIMKKVAGELGVIPSKQILEFIDDDNRWQEKRKALNLDQRVEKIRASQTEFSRITDSHQLAELLHQDENKAMIYYLLHGGEDRFNLINKYEFDKFKEMLGLIAELRVHEKPLRQFQETLLGSGLSRQEADQIISRLRAGHFPLAKESQAGQEISFEVSKNAAMENANTEIGRVLGREQLAVILLFPLYREYLQTKNTQPAQEFLKQISNASTFAERQAFIEQINQSFPDFQEQAKKDLQPNWLKFGEKMVMELTLDQVLNQATVPIHGEEVLPKLDAKRIDLKRIKKEVLILLKNESQAIKDISQKITQKKKARQGLALGLEKQTDEAKRRGLQGKIDEIDQALAKLEQDRKLLGEIKAEDRFSDLNPEERQKMVDDTAREIVALTEKSPSAIFTYITMQVLGEERLTESDLGLIREMESHLQGPFQTITDLLTYERKPQEATKKRTHLRLEYLDKTNRLMAMMRFADSKICCFSSSNYEMRVQHDTPNKYWVASINADPLSFVISMEVPSEQPAQPNQLQVKENLGFIFGSFAINENGKLAIMLNGIYYASGIDNPEQVKVILDGVEKIFTGLPIKTMALASIYGGAGVGEKLPPEYSKEPIELTRLRALDSGDGRPEIKIYDDLGTNDNLNRPATYPSKAVHAGMVYHKDF